MNKIVVPVVPVLAAFEAALASGKPIEITITKDGTNPKPCDLVVVKIEPHLPEGTPLKRPMERVVTGIVQTAAAMVEVEVIVPIEGGNGTIRRTRTVGGINLWCLLPKKRGTASSTTTSIETLNRRVEEVPELKPFLPTLRRSGIVYVAEACMVPVRRGGKGKEPNIGLRLRMALESIGIPQTYHPTDAGPYAWRPPYWDDPALIPKLRQMAIELVVLDETDVPGTPWYQEFVSLQTGDWIILVRKNRIRRGDPDQVDMLGWSFDRLQRVQSKLRPDSGIHAAMIFPPNWKET